MKIFCKGETFCGDRRGNPIPVLSVLDSVIEAQNLIRLLIHFLLFLNSLFSALCAPICCIHSSPLNTQVLNPRIQNIFGNIYTAKDPQNPSSFLNGSEIPHTKDCDSLSCHSPRTAIPKHPNLAPSSHSFVNTTKLAGVHFHAFSFIRPLLGPKARVLCGGDLKPP